MVSSALNIWLFIVIVVLLSTNIWDIAYFFGMFSWYIGQVLNLTSYIGASCWNIMTVSWLFWSVVVAFLLIKLYHYFKPWGN